MLTNEIGERGDVVHPLPPVELPERLQHAIAGRDMVNKTRKATISDGRLTK